MNRPDLYMLSDDVKQTLAEVRDMGNFLLTLGREWKKCRSKHYKTMPVKLLHMLDELADVLVCEEKNCRELVHEVDNGAWDFCFEHGHPRHKWEDGKCYCGATRKLTTVKS